MEPDEINTSDWVQMIQTKAEKVDLERIQEIKANKQDVEHQMNLKMTKVSLGLQNIKGPAAKSNSATNNRTLKRFKVPGSLLPSNLLVNLSLDRKCPSVLSIWAQVDSCA